MQTATDASSFATTASRDEARNTEGPAADEERHALKRTYLTLLPHTQLVELCLAFEAHSPLHIKSSLWPTNLAAAVAELQLPTQTVQETPTDDPRVASHTEALASGASNHETSAADESPRPQQPTIADDTSQPTLQGVPSTSIQSATIPPSPGPYHHIPYGYPQTQPLAAYPHTPYYTLFSHAHNFPPHPSASYAHTSYPQSQPPAGQTSFSPFTGIPLARHPHTIGVPPTDHNGIPADDLPSYEDMLVEALTDLNEPDGSAPKSLFTWMASRYPLHSNFRPSASQALQKAFKRGRLEKGSNGKYRLNASWDGGSTSKRTTRRPQTIAQSALPASQGAPPASPFTHTPLAHAGRNSLPYISPPPIPSATQDKPSHYAAFPHRYTSGGAYSGYVLSEAPPAPKGKTTIEQAPVVTASNISTQEPTVENNVPNEDVGEGSDAWEAAQTILKAINFGPILQAPVVKPPEPAVKPLSPSVPSGSTVAVPHGRLVSPITADEGAIDGTAIPGPVEVLSNRDRASLQAQLALLAAQLAEIAEDTLASIAAS